jgi:multicomponent Na+:H+ antiporter subunit F
MSGWLIAAGVTIAALAPLGTVAVRGEVEDGLVALELAGTTSAVAVLLLAHALGEAYLADVALVLAVASFVGSLAFATLLERER